MFSSPAHQPAGNSTGNQSKLNWLLAKPTPKLTLKTWLLIGFLIFISINIILTVIFFHDYQDRFYQGIYIDNIYVGGLTKQAALEHILKSAQYNPQSFAVELQVDDIKIASSSTELGQKLDYRRALNQAFETGRSGFPFTRLATVIQLKTQPQHFYSQIVFEDELVSGFINLLGRQVNQAPIEPAAQLLGTGAKKEVEIIAGTPGRQIDVEQTFIQLNDQLLATAIQQAGQPTPQSLQVSQNATVASIGATLNEAEMAQAKLRAAKFIDKSAVFQTRDVKLNLNDQQLVGLLSFTTQSTPLAEMPTLKPKLNDIKLAALLAQWQVVVNRPAQDAAFEYDPQTLKVTKFQPHLDGLALDQVKTTAQLEELINQIENTNQEAAATKVTDGQLNEPYQYELAVAAAPPQKSLADTNNLGIKEQIGYGESYYAHSIPTRIYNVAHTTEIINYTIVKPGEEFSFNKVLGEVSAKTGFKPAYVIRNGRTELGDGGGVCQVSTTLFRALLDAGLKITKRKAHSYRVSYYELDKKVGFDATVYSGDTDLRFINDTSQHLIIVGQTDSEHTYMTMRIYGTSDGRTAKISDYKQWDYRNPPAPVYIDDPSLPRGAVKQIDWSASGIKSSFKHTVYDKNGTIMYENTYFSNYQPWSAKYLRGV